MILSRWLILINYTFARQLLTTIFTSAAFSARNPLHNILRGIFRTAWRTPRSPRISVHLLVPSRNVNMVSLTFRASQNSIKFIRPLLSQYQSKSKAASLPFHLPVKHFNCLSHARLCQSSATKDLNRLIGNLMRRASCKHLQQTDGTSEMSRLLLVWHQSHLVCDVFQP